MSLMGKYLIASFAIHLLLFLGIVLKIELQLPQLPKPNHKHVDVEIIERPKDLQDNKIFTMESGGDIPAQTKENDDDCKSYFGGIGVTHSIDWDSLDFRFIVIKVHKGYPAEVAGIRAGDKISSLNNENIKGTVGTDIVLKVNRNGKEYQTTITRGKICTDKIKRKQ